MILINTSPLSISLSLNCCELLCHVCILFRLARTPIIAHRIIDDMLDILAVIERPILQAIRTSQAVGLELSESTDVSVLTQLDINVRYVNV